MDSTFNAMEAVEEYLKDFPVYRQAGWIEPKTGANFPFLFFSLVFTTLAYVWDHYLNRRQLDNFVVPHKTVPAGLDGVSMEVFKKSLVYGADKLSFEIQENRFMFAYGLILTLGGFLPWIWDYAQQLCLTTGLISSDPTASSSLYKEGITTCVMVFLFSVHDTIVSLPFSYYRTFVIEQHHGFNKSTLGLWIKDKVISLLLVLAIGSPVLYVIVWLARTCGAQFPLYVWGFLLFFGLVMMVAYPTLIAPLFNKYEDLEDGELKDAIVSLAKQVDFPLKKLYTMDGSKRSGHSNAFFYGFGKSKMIVLFDTLIAQVSQKELLAILGHEIGHWRLWHTIEGFVITQAYTLCLFLCFSYVQSSPELFGAFGFASGDSAMPVFVGLLLFTQTAWAPVDKLLTFLLNWNSRRNEFAADKYSKDLGMAEELASGLVKISVENLGNMVPDPLYSIYHFSHPPVVERIAAMGVSESEKKSEKKNK